MINFNIEDYDETYVMHCKTEEDANEFLEYLDSLGFTWGNGTSYIGRNRWHEYGENTYYRFMANSYGSLDYARQQGYKILEFDDFVFYEDDAELPQMSFAEMCEALGCEISIKEE